MLIDLRKPSKKLIFIIIFLSFLLTPQTAIAKELTTKQAESILNIIIDKTYTLLTYYSSPWIYPVDGIITSPYGPRGSSIDGFHHGLDISAVENSPVHASKLGVVVKAEFNEMVGNVVCINHSDGFQTMYAHNNKLLVKVGDNVEQNGVIALSGNTGLLSRGPHVHFEIRTNNGTNSLNPMNYLPAKQK